METTPQLANIKKLLIAVGVILVFGVLLQQYFKRVAQPGSSSGEAQKQETERVTIKTDTNRWQEYTNEKLGFLVKYPKGTTLRGTPESDLAILTLERNATGNKQALITLTKKKVPLGREPYKTIEEFWKDEEGFISANSGVSSNARYVELNGRTFWEAREDNRQNNYMGLHRYLKEGENIYEATLTIEGEKLEASVMEFYNEILTTLTVKG